MKVTIKAGCGHTGEKETMYAAYLLTRAPFNVATSHPGFGASRPEAVQDALYWHNQAPWLVVQPESRWPQWVWAYFREATQLEDDVCCVICGRSAPGRVERRYALNYRCSRCVGDRSVGDSGGSVGAGG